MPTSRTWLLAAAVCSSAALFVLACVGEESAPPATDTDARIDGGTTADGSASPPLGDASPTATPDARTEGDASPPRYCATRTTPPGATDFFCADFDGPDAAAGWKSVVRDDGGTLDVTSDVWTSSPNALIVRSQNGEGAVFGGGALFWSAAGAKNVQQIVLRASINPTTLGGIAPTYTGEVQLAEVGTDDVAFVLHYTRGGAIGSPANIADFTGYYVTAAATGGAAVIEAQDLPNPAGQLAGNAWTKIELTYVATSGQMKLTYNNVAVFDRTLYSSTQTKAHAQIGAVASGIVKLPEAVRFDDVEISVQRGP